MLGWTENCLKGRCIIVYLQYGRKFHGSLVRDKFDAPLLRDKCFELPLKSEEGGGRKSIGLFLL